MLTTDPIVRAFVLAPLALIAVDVLTGIGDAIKTKSFRLPDVGQFTWTSLAPYVAILMTFATLVLGGTPYLAASATLGAAMSTFCAAQLGSIIEHLVELLPLPSAEVSAFVTSLYKVLYALGIYHDKVFAANDPTVDLADRVAPRLPVADPATAPVVTEP